jgi:acetyl-CoA carboxylase biotin carboxyl carrier protein
MAKQAKGSRDGDDEHDHEHELVTMARGLAEIVASHGLSELIVDTKETTLTIRRGVALATATASAPLAMTPMTMMPGLPQPMASAPPLAIASQPVVATVEDKAHVVTSPFVGTFYRKPNPDSPVYAQLNDKVDKGTVLCIVEAMKLMNEIESDAAGTVVGILVEDGAPVEYGQALFKIAL